MLFVGREENLRFLKTTDIEIALCVRHKTIKRNRERKNANFSKSILPYRTISIKPTHNLSQFLQWTRNFLNDKKACELQLKLAKIIRKEEKMQTLAIAHLCTGWFSNVSMPRRKFFSNYRIFSFHLLFFID